MPHLACHLHLLQQTGLLMLLPRPAISSTKMGQLLTTGAISARMPLLLLQTLLASPNQLRLAAPASSASVLTDSYAGDSYHDSDRLAASDRPLSSDGQDCGHLPQQHGSRADEGPALPASAQSGMVDTGIRRAGAVGGIAGVGPESAGSRLEASETKRSAKHGLQQQQQQRPPSGSTSRAAGSDTSPHKHIGQLFFCHQLLCG